MRSNSLLTRLRHEVHSTVAESNTEVGRADMKTLTISLFLSLLTAIALAQPVDIPKPPPGFHWQRAEEVKAAFLVPDGWHFKSEQNGKTQAYFATREDIDKDGKFLTGLTVNVVRHLEGEDAAEYAKRFIAGFQDGKKVRKTWDPSMGSFAGAACLVEDEHAVMHTMMLANRKTNTLYFFMFEAPKAEWQAAWQTGEQIVRFLLLDDEV